MSSVYFRALELEDLPYIHKWMNDQEMLKDAIGLKRPMSMVECREWLERRVKPDAYNFWFAICLNDGSGKMIGYTGVNDIHFVNSSATCNAIVIGEKEYRDGISWIETNLLIREFIFERLHLNRYYGRCSEEQKTTMIAHKLFLSKVEGVERQAIWNNGAYRDVYLTAVLRDEYLALKAAGEFELSAIIRRFKKIIKEEK